MSHEIFGDRFAGYRTLGWPKLGTTFDDPNMDAVTAGGLAKVFFQISKQPMLAQMPDHSLVRTDKWMLVREPTADDQNYRPFGVVSDSYQFFQNRDIAELIKKYLGKYPVETVGALEQGKAVFYLLRLGGAEIAGDAHETYLLVTDRRDGGTALKVASVVVRVVCANTLAAALGSSLATFSIAHTGSHLSLTEDRMAILQRVEGGMKQTLDRLRRLTELKLTPEQLERVVKAAFPPPVPPKKAGLRQSLGELGVPLTALDIDFDAADNGFVNAAERAQLFRTAAGLTIAQFDAERPQYAGTGWSAYNGIVEFADFREGGTDAQAQHSALFGWRAAEKARALKEIELIAAGR